MSDERTEFGSSDHGRGSLGKARHGVPDILAAGRCTWKWRSSPAQEVFPLSFHIAQQHVKDTASHSKSCWWGGEFAGQAKEGS